MAEAILMSGGSSVDLDVLTTSPGHVRKGQIFMGAGSDEPQTGTMPEINVPSTALNAGWVYTIPAGYHPGTEKVAANSLASQTGGATATDAQVLSEQKYWKDGVLRTGTMANQGTKNQALNAGGSYTIPAGYHNGAGKVTANSLASQTSATAAAADILSGKNAWVNGTKVNGSMAALAGGTYTPKASQQTISCSGKKMTSNIIIAGDADLVAANILSGKNIFGVAGNAKGYRLGVYSVYPSASTGQFVRSNSGSDVNVSLRYCTIDSPGFTSEILIAQSTTQYNYLTFIIPSNRGCFWIINTASGSGQAIYINRGIASLSKDKLLFPTLAPSSERIYVMAAGYI